MARACSWQLAVGNWVLTICLPIAIGITSYILPAQEVISDLTMNPLVAKKYFERKNSTLRTTPIKLDTLTLPFMDDFSKEDIFPDTSLWLDDAVFINRDYPIAPPTLGVATFEGVSRTGCPYDTMSTGTNASTADTLTSKPIDLSAAANVYLSFYWQAKGRGNDPEPADTLLLQFKNPTTNSWNTVWYRNGYTPSGTDTGFHLVHISIADTAFLKSAFQFRFRNWATVTGNVDHWHLDYVFLDKNRNSGDTIFSDVAFVYNSRSLLKNYYAMPWEQYDPSTEMKTNLAFCIRNNDTIQKSADFTDTIYSSNGVVQSSYGVFTDNINPWPGYWLNPVFATPPVSTTPPNYVFPALSQDSSFLMEAVVHSSTDDNRWNDTLRFTQTFANYYAYDDGTVESGYGLVACPGPGQIAYKFTLNNPDTLFALQMLFNWIGPNVNQQQFRIRVWNDAGGIPGTMIYEDGFSTPNYQYVYHNQWGNLTNLYYPYILATPQVLSGTFYVGFVQYTYPCSTLINLGLDKNTDSRSKMFYNTGSSWSASSINFPCSWMMRPVFGTTEGLLTVHNEAPEMADIRVYPNPSTGQLKVQSLRFKVSSLKIFNVMGKMIYESSEQAMQDLSLDLSEHPAGIYFIRITDERGIDEVQKFVLTK